MDHLTLPKVLLGFVSLMSDSRPALLFGRPQVNLFVLREKDRAQGVD